MSQIDNRNYVLSSQFQSLKKTALADKTLTKEEYGDLKKEFLATNKAATEEDFNTLLSDALDGKIDNQSIASLKESVAKLSAHGSAPIAILFKENGTHDGFASAVTFEVKTTDPQYSADLKEHEDFVRSLQLDNQPTSINSQMEPPKLCTSAELEKLVGHKPTPEEIAVLEYTNKCLATGQPQGADLKMNLQEVYAVKLEGMALQAKTELDQAVLMEVAARVKQGQGFDTTAMVKDVHKQKLAQWVSSGKAEQLAKQAYDAMDGGGTNEDKLVGAFLGLTAAQREEVVKAFEKMSSDAGYTYDKSQYSNALMYWVDGDVSESSGWRQKFMDAYMTGDVQPDTEYFYSSYVAKSWSDFCQDSDSNAKAMLKDPSTPWYLKGVAHFNQAVFASAEFVNDSVDVAQKFYMEKINDKNSSGVMKGLSYLGFFGATIGGSMGTNAVRRDGNWQKVEEGLGDVAINLATWGAGKLLAAGAKTAQGQKVLAKVAKGLDKMGRATYKLKQAIPFLARNTDYYAKQIVKMEKILVTAEKGSIRFKNAEAMLAKFKTAEKAMVDAEKAAKAAEEARVALEAMLKQADDPERVAQAVEKAEKAAVDAEKALIEADAAAAKAKIPPAPPIIDDAAKAGSKADEAGKTAGAVDDAGKTGSKADALAAQKEKVTQLEKAAEDAARAERKADGAARVWFDGTSKAGAFVDEWIAKPLLNNPATRLYDRIGKVLSSDVGELAQKGWNKFKPNVIDKKVVSINDMHGNLETTVTMLDEAKKSGKLGKKGENLVVIGDVIDKGPDSHAIMKYLRENFPEARYVIGNHEEKMLAGIDDLAKYLGDSPSTRLKPADVLADAEKTLPGMAEKLKKLDGNADLLDPKTMDSLVQQLPEGERLKAKQLLESMADKKLTDLKTEFVKDPKAFATKYPELNRIMQSKAASLQDFLTKVTTNSYGSVMKPVGLTGEGLTQATTLAKQDLAKAMGIKLDDFEKILKESKFDKIRDTFPKLNQDQLLTLNILTEAKTSEEAAAKLLYLEYANAGGDLEKAAKSFGGKYLSGPPGADPGLLKKNLDGLASIHDDAQFFKKNMGAYIVDKETGTLYVHGGMPFRKIPEPEVLRKALLEIKELSTSQILDICSRAKTESLESLMKNLPGKVSPDTIKQIEKSLHDAMKASKDSMLDPTLIKKLDDKYRSGRYADAADPTNFHGNTTNTGESWVDTKGNNSIFDWSRKTSDHNDFSFRSTQNYEEKLKSAMQEFDPNLKINKMITGHEKIQAVKEVANVDALKGALKGKVPDEWADKFADFVKSRSAKEGGFDKEIGQWVEDFCKKNPAAVKHKDDLLAAGQASKTTQMYESVAEAGGAHIRADSGIEAGRFDKPNAGFMVEADKNGVTLFRAETNVVGYEEFLEGALKKAGFDPENAKKIAEKHRFSQEAADVKKSAGKVEKALIEAGKDPTTAKKMAQAYEEAATKAIDDYTALLKTQALELHKGERFFTIDPPALEKAKKQIGSVLGKDPNAKAALEKLYPKASYPNIKSQDDLIKQFMKDYYASMSEIDGLIAKQFGEALPLAKLDSIAPPQQLLQELAERVKTGQGLPSINPSQALKKSANREGLIGLLEKLDPPISKTEAVLKFKLPTASKVSADELAKTLGLSELGLEEGMVVGSMTIRSGQKVRVALSLDNGIATLKRLDKLRDNADKAGETIEDTQPKQPEPQFKPVGVQFGQ